MSRRGWRERKRKCKWKRKRKRKRVRQRVVVAQHASEAQVDEASCAKTAPKADSTEVHIDEMKLEFLVSLQYFLLQIVRPLQRPLIQGQHVLRRQKR